jgi:ABC-type branched-subunit amino acid transport system ATPase component
MAVAERFKAETFIGQLNSIDATRLKLDRALVARTGLLILNEVMAGLTASSLITGFQHVLGKEVVVPKEKGSNCMAFGHSEGVCVMDLKGTFQLT